MSSAPQPAPFFGAGRRPLGGRSLALSILFHAIALAAVFWVIPVLQPDQPVYRVMEIEIRRIPMAAAPPPEEPEPPASEDELVVETPDDPEPPAVEQEDPIPLLDEEEPEPEPEPDSVETPEAPPPEETPPPAETPVPAESEQEDEEEEEEQLSFEQLQVRQEGFKSEHPEYFANVLRQVDRCLRTNEDRVVTVRFDIDREGRTFNLGVVRSSGRNTFDWEVLEAVECAGRLDRLGPLPEDYPYDVLPIILAVAPQREESDQSGQEGDRGWRPQCAH